MSDSPWRQQQMRVLFVVQQEGVPLKPPPSSSSLRVFRVRVEGAVGAELWSRGVSGLRPRFLVPSEPGRERRPRRRSGWKTWRLAVPAEGGSCRTVGSAFPLSVQKQWKAVRTGVLSALNSSSFSFSQQARFSACQKISSYSSFNPAGWQLIYPSFSAKMAGSTGLHGMHFMCPV